MKDHYRVLDLPKNATEEQIRTQYKLLVRVYHPDRFTKSDDRAYAEQKIKEINEAYSTLLKPFNANSSFVDPDQPVPVVIPSYIDFGTLYRGERKTVPLSISNARGQVNDLHFDFSDSRSWFVLNEAKLLTTTADAKLQFEVVANTNELVPGRTYKGWIDVRMQSSVTRVNLAVKVTTERAAKQATDRSTIIKYLAFGIAALVLSALLATYVPRYLVSTFTNNSTSSTPPSDVIEQPSQTSPTNTAAAIADQPISAQPISEQLNDTVFKALPLLENLSIQSAGAQALATDIERISYQNLENNRLVFYTAQFDGKGQQRLKIEGEDAAWNVPGTHVAYLQSVKGVKQIFILQATNQSVQSVQQVTDTPNAKRTLIWSPNGNELAYLQEDKPGREALYVISLTDQKPRSLKIFERGTTTGFSWHPDNKTLLFSQLVNKSSRIYRISSQRNDLLQLTDFESTEPAWSPDGKNFAAVSDQGVYVVSADGKTPVQLGNQPAKLARWSADGQTLAYLRLPTVSNNKTELWTVRVDQSTEATKLASGVVNFVWSPYSARIAYTTGDFNSSKLSTLYLWTIEPNQQAQLVAETMSPNIAWVP